MRLPQRLLAIELRTEIDRARLAGDAVAARRALDLARTHPSALRSKHVTHNLKPERLAWLEGAHARALSQVDPRPLVGDIDEETTETGDT
jgi:hypothetical protein